MTELTLRSPLVRATLTPVSAMLLDAAFLVDGVEHRPFARAPWIGEPGLDQYPGHLRELAGEFVAVPFGAAGAPAGLRADWAAIVPPEHPARPHGPAADDEWAVLEQSESSVTFSLDYAEPSGIERLERRVSIRPDAAALDFSLTLFARRPVSTAVGLHPIFRLPSEPGALSIDASFDEGLTYPGPVWPGSGPTRPGQAFAALDAAPGRSGEPVDLSRLPLRSPTEDIVLLAGARGPVQLRFADSGSRAVLDWDRSVLPNVMLWISDRVLAEEPWGGRYRGLGVEATAAAFDFPESVSIGTNPLSAAGHRTSVAVEPGSPVRVSYSVEVSGYDE